MLFKEEEAQQFVRKITQLAGSMPEEERTEYVRTLSTELIAALNTKQNLQTVDRGEDFFAKMTGEIRSAFHGDFSFHSIEEAHFAYARLLRILSFGGFHDFSDHPIVNFYLWPHYKEINQKRIDLIRFEIPSEHILSPYKTALDKTVKHVEHLEQWEEHLTGWQKSVEGNLQSWQGRADDTEKRYQNIVEGQNYLGLARAFVNLINQKKIELANTWKVLCGIGAAVLLVPMIYLFVGNSDFLQDLIAGNIKFSSVSIFVFSIVLEALLLYYFRIAYSQWSSIKHQILQLNLRHQMCAFANEYAHSSSGMDRNTLSKFENLVFSELSQDANTPPSIYDAVDSIAKVIGSIRNGGKGET